MKIKSKLKHVVSNAKKTLDDLFWETASSERDPVKSLKITQQISQAITEHERNVHRKLSQQGPSGSQRVFIARV